MSTTLSFSFPWGRYHATPWGRHVNEAAVEWPPSPWRILRALYATWRARAPDLDGDTIAAVLNKLSGPPSFVLPDFREAHTRHYMPAASHMSGSNRGTDKAIDAFTVFERDAAILATWAATLEPGEAQCLAVLASKLPYLGRAESVCQASLYPAEPDLNCACTPVAAATADEDAPVRVLVPLHPVDLAAITVTTDAIRRRRLVDPPGARWQLYRRPRPAEARIASPTRRVAAKPTAVRWAVASPAPPAIRGAVATGDVLRLACMARFGRRFDGGASDVLSGKDAGGHPLSGHRHSHYLCVDSDGDGLVDHLVAWAPAGFDERAAAAACDVDRLTGFGHIADFRPIRLGLEAVGDIGRVAPELVGPATVWRSHTPFAPPRHWRRHDAWSEIIAAQVVRELAYRDLPVPDHIEVLRGDWLNHRRHRPTTERLADGRRAAGIRLEFGAPVRGPLALGALSHFGLGLLLPES